MLSDHNQIICFNLILILRILSLSVLEMENEFNKKKLHKFHQNKSQF